ncbi:NAD(P) transhydrogenase subunit alpha [Sphingobium sp.]|uniref:NAD(P) transhydrogenase subunit alpha n=1 Tax=Sphingobium sp. TaxID=1912891 RepID=UPI002606F562|nr:NAD(P) transhydrogenase subunit alpha [Sphingobium sp.]
MTGAFALLPLFLLACLGGALASRRAASQSNPALGAGIASILLVGALIAAAETGSAAARYLALLAVFCASAAAILAFGVGEHGEDEEPLP